MGRSCGWVGYNVRGTAAREPRATTPRHMAEAAGVAAIDGSARTQLAKENSRQVSCYGRTQCKKYKVLRIAWRTKICENMQNFSFLGLKISEILIHGYHQTHVRLGSGQQQL